MTITPGPPSYPPYSPPPYGGGYGAGPRPGSSSATVVTALLAVVFVAATALAAWVVHGRGAESASPVAPPGASAVPQQAGGNGGVPAAGGASYSPSSVPTPSLSTSAYTPPAPTPTPTPLSAQTIDRTFQVYMNALLNRSLSQLKSATCPKYRDSETGTALDGKYINRWQSRGYRIYDSLDYVIIPTTVRYVDPNTGGNGGTHTYNWYVTRYPSGQYWVCGIQT